MGKNEQTKQEIINEVFADFKKIAKIVGGGEDGLLAKGELSLPSGILGLHNDKFIKVEFEDYKKWKGKYKVD